MATARQPGGTGAGRLWTADDVADRWMCEVEAVWRAVDKGGLPFLYLGRGTPTRGRRGQRGLYRFRPADVEAWEAAQARPFAAPAGRAKVAPAPAVVGTLGIDVEAVLGPRPVPRRA